MDRKAFSLLEMLVTVAVIAALAIGVLILINPLSIINRGNDASRKKNLDDAKKALEEYMADTGCYPQPTQICTEGTNINNCHICTKQKADQFSYFKKDMCDPKAEQLPYMYRVEKYGGAPAVCPKWFHIYSVLESAYNAAEDLWGCKKGGCGVPPQYGYSYLVTSPGAPVDNMTATNWFCFVQNDCTNCGVYENCSSPSNECYEQLLYPSKTLCCNSNDPNSPYCI